MKSGIKDIVGLTIQQKGMRRADLLSPPPSGPG